MAKIKTATQAIQIAIEMEKRAIRTYQQGITVTDGKNPELCQCMKDIILDEWGHLGKFYEIRSKILANDGKQLSKSDIALAKAEASQALFPGGFLDMVRSGSREGQLNFLKFALTSELSACQYYSDVAESFTDSPAAGVFEMIAQEEEQHVQKLYNDLLQMGS